MSTSLSLFTPFIFLVKSYKYIDVKKQMNMTRFTLFYYNTIFWFKNKLQTKKVLLVLQENMKITVKEVYGSFWCIKVVLSVLAIFFPSGNKIYYKKQYHCTN